MDSDLSSTVDLVTDPDRKPTCSQDSEDRFELYGSVLRQGDCSSSPAEAVNGGSPRERTKPTCSQDSEDRFELYGSILRQGDRSSSPAEAVYGGSPRERTDDMGVEDACDLNNTWDDDANLLVPEQRFPTPLPPSTSYNELSQATRPTSPNFNADFGQLFNPDPNSDVIEKSKPGVCGVSNLGNTCFMNSGLQCLLNTPSLVQLFIGHVKDTSASDTLVTHFANLLQKIWSGNFSKVKPTEFQLAFANQHVQFKDYRQHDCQEFLALLLGTLHELLNTASSKSNVSDLSADPLSPRSVCEESNVPVPDSVETDSTGRLALVGARCEITSSSSRSSESSIGVSRFKKLSIPPNLTEATSVDACDEATKSADICETDSNLIPECALKRDCKLVNVAADLNNRQPSISDIIHKDTKTSNVNVVVPEVTTNNHVVFDSEKYPKNEINRRREYCDIRNLTASYDFEEKTGSKRMINSDLEMDGIEDTSDYGSLEPSSGYSVSNKRCKLEEPLETEKNEVMECALKLGLADKLRADARGMCGASTLSCHTSALHAVDDDIEADKQWDKHIGLNQSVIVDSFQGQFKSTVVCSECRHSSSTYEPFMYLSVPLPHAMEQQVPVTYVPASCGPPTKFLITLNRQDKVLHIKQQLRVLLCAHDSMLLEMAEVLDHHIARILDENQLIKCVSSFDRSIYAFEMSDENTSSEGDLFGYVPLDLTDQTNLNNSDSRKSESDAKISTLTNDLQSQACYVVDECGVATAKTEDECLETRPDRPEEPKSCTICLDDAERPMKNHVGCNCYLCDGCIEMSLKHYKESKEDDKPDGVMQCPVCNALINPDVDLVDASECSQEQPSSRMLNVPVLFRSDLSADHGQPSHQLFGHPHLIRVSNNVSATLLHRIISRLVPCEIDAYSVLLVDGQGYHCSRCMYTSGCRGCELPRMGDITLRASDNLAISFLSGALDVPLVEHESLHGLRKQENLSIYDCLSAFCESEKLDEHNPWYCPSCNCNQSATKTLSVWRYPDYLIVYLKRFVFYEYTSVKLDNKVSFPLTDLKLPSNQPGMSLSFDLYACVNHIGGASAGHYTAHAKNPKTGEWHLFNDETVTPQMPEESDFSNAYILFYQIQKQGLQSSSHMPCLTATSTIESDHGLSFDLVPDPLSLAGQSSLV